MPTNALLKTNVSGTWSSSTGLSYSQIPTISGISHKDQLEVERVFTVPSGTVLTQEDFRKIYVIPAANYTVDETSKKITAFSASLPSYTTVGGTIVSVPAITNGAVIAIRRKSITSESLVNWVDGTRLTASQLNLQTSQLISVVQEILDRMNYEFVTATDLDYNFGYKWSTRSWVEGRLGAISTDVKTYIDAADTNLQNQITTVVGVNTTQNGRLDAIESLNTSQTSSINTLNTRVSPSTSLTGTYSASNLSAAVNGLDTRTTSVESRVTSVESTNTTQTNNISALQTKVGAGTVTGTIVANGSDIITAVNAIDDYVTNAVTTGTNTIFNGHAQGRIVYAGANGTKDSTANFTITPSGTNPTVLTLAGNLSQTGNLTQTGVLNLTGNTTSVLSLTGTFTVNADSATVPTFKGASTQKIIAFKNSSNTEVNAIDQYGNLTGRATATYGSSSPTNPIAGSIWYDSANTSFKVYDGSAWNQVSTTTLANYVGLSGNETVAGNKTFSGNIGIGGANGTGNKLLVTSAATNTGLQVINGLVRVDNNGSVGLQSLILAGNGSNLQVSHEANSLLTLTNSGTTGGGFQFKGSSTAALTIDTSGNVGIGTASPVYKLSLSSTAGLQGWATDGTVQQAFAYPASTLAYAGTVSNHPYALIVNNAERMRIDSSGNVGIGTGSPNHKLVVSNAGSEGLEIVPGNTAGITAIQTYNRSNSTYDTMDLRASDFKIRIGSTEKVTIDSSGNVGIGTISPLNKLHIKDGGICYERTNNATRQYTNLGSFYSGNPSTGIIEIALPSTNWQDPVTNIAINPILDITISGMLSSSTPCSWTLKINAFHVGGQYGVTPKWASSCAHITGRCPFNTVRLGYNTTTNKPVILLGETTTAYASTNSIDIRIDSVSASYLDTTSSIFNRQWEFTGGITSTSNYTLNYTGSNPTISYSLDRDGYPTFRRTTIFNTQLGVNTSTPSIVSGNSTDWSNVAVNITGSTYGRLAIQGPDFGLGGQLILVDNNTATSQKTWVLGSYNGKFTIQPYNNNATPITTTKTEFTATGFTNTGIFSNIGATSITSNGQTLTLNGTDHSYIGFEPITGGGRKAYIGFGVANDTTLTIANENASGTINLTKPTTVSGNLTVSSNNKLISPTVETDVIQSTGTLEFRGDYDASATADMTINSSGVVVFANPPLYGAVPLAYPETSVSAQAASAASGFRFGTNTKNYSTTSLWPVKYTKTGRIVVVSGLVEYGPTSSATNTQAITTGTNLLVGLPPVETGTRKMFVVRRALSATSGGATAEGFTRIDIDASGNLTYGDTSQYWGPAGVWISVDITYIAAS